MRSQKKIQWSAFLAGISVMAMAGAAFAESRYGAWSYDPDDPDGPVASDTVEGSGCYLEGSWLDYNIQGHTNAPVCIAGECMWEIYRNNLVIAIHGGTIESGTDELAWEVAWNNRLCISGGFCTEQASLYQMIAHVQPGTCPSPDPDDDPFAKIDDDLHITATKYNEPQALDMANDAYSIVSIHGLKDTSYSDLTYPYDDNAVCVGGLNEEMRDDFISQVNNDSLLSGWLDAVDATVSGLGCPSSADGDDPYNIVNRGPNPNGGLQLEFTKTARNNLFAPGNEDERDRLVEIIQDVMHTESLEAP